MAPWDPTLHPEDVAEALVAVGVPATAKTVRGWEFAEQCAALRWAEDKAWGKSSSPPFRVSQLLGRWR